MRKAAVFGILFTLATSLLAQEREYQTLVDFDEVRISGVGGPFMQFTTVDGEFAHMLGGGGAVMLNNFWIGGYGLGLTNNIQADSTYYNAGDFVNANHGGFWLGYSLFGDKAVHVSISTLLGWGNVGVQREFDFDPSVSDGVFVVCPTLEVELNLTQYFRISAGASYNLYTFVKSLEGYNNSDFSSPGAFLSFKFGWF